MSDIIIEDGSLVVGSNSFVTANEALEYVTDRGEEDLDVNIIKPLVLLSYDFMISLPWCFDINMAFVVTDNMKIAQMEMIRNGSQGFEFFYNPIDDRVKRVLDVTADLTDEIEYFEGSKSVGSARDILNQMPKAKSLLSGLVCFSDETVTKLMVV